MLSFIDNQVVESVLPLISKYLNEVDNFNESEISNFNELFSEYKIQLKTDKSLEHKEILELIESKNIIPENTHIDLMNLKQFKNRYPPPVKKHLENILSTFN